MGGQITNSCKFASSRSSANPRDIDTPANLVNSGTILQLDEDDDDDKKYHLASVIFCIHNENQVKM